MEIVVAPNTEWAHILAGHLGGLDEPANLHLLCPTCHTDSEFLAGDDYFEWLRQRTIWDKMASGLTRFYGCSAVEVAGVLRGEVSDRLAKLVRGNTVYGRAFRERYGDAA